MSIVRRIHASAIRAEILLPTIEGLGVREAPMRSPSQSKVIIRKLAVFFSPELVKL